jgi:uncharacterized protein (DUF433 family)
MQPLTNNYIEIRPNRDGEPRPYLAGTRVRVQDIVSDHERYGLSPDEIAREYPHLTLAQIHAALAYYFDHREEIRAMMKSDEEYSARSASEANQVRTTAKQTHGDPIPS